MWHLHNQAKIVDFDYRHSASRDSWEMKCLKLHLIHVVMMENGCILLLFDLCGFCIRLYPRASKKLIRLFFAVYNRILGNEL